MKEKPVIILGDFNVTPEDVDLKIPKWHTGTSVAGNTAEER